MIPPGQTIGILGGGPLGRMLAQAAQALGYRVGVFEPSAANPAGAVVDRAITADYEDLAALRTFARECDVVTCAYENIPLGSLNAVGSLVPLHPRAEVLHLTQSRERAKAWLRAHGFPQVRYAEALDGDIVSVIGQVGRPCVVKSADYSSDGRGQMKISSDEDLERAEAIFRGRRCVLERWVDFSCELAVIVARSTTGEVKAFPIAENIHTRNILDFSLVPARISAAAAREAEHLAVTLAEKLGVIGLLAVEFFLDSNGALLVNELAARPHDGGHWSLDGCETSQFEQHIRAICGLPLGDVDLRQPTVMVNLLGDLWHRRRGPDEPGSNMAGLDPNWSVLLTAPRTKVHFHGRIEPLPGRKMGHFTVRDADLETALTRARDLKLAL